MGSEVLIPEYEPAWPASSPSLLTYHSLSHPVIGPSTSIYYPSLTWAGPLYIQSLLHILIPNPSTPSPPLTATMHTVSLLALLASTASAATIHPRQSTVNQAVIPKSFGVTAGQGRDAIQVGSCTGANNKPIPCFCPPAPNSPDFLGKLTKALTDGFIFSRAQVAIPITLAKFNDAADTSVETNKLRATAMIQVLQNFNLTQQGVGCPGVSAPLLGVMQLTGKTDGNAASLGNSG